MKNIIYILVIVFTVISCKNDDDNLTPLEQLPPATQTGEGTFGCLVNGEAFVETGTFFNCFYQFNNGKYFFSISADFDSQEPCNIDIGTNSLEIVEGESYNLFSSTIEGQAGAALFFCNELSDYETNTENSGKLIITKLDFEKNIVSGTFYFDILNTNNNKFYRVTNGRFDTLFTQ